ncbi:MAG: YcaO-like family protein [Acidobacteriota bacterium]
MATPSSVAPELRDVDWSDPWDTVRRGARLISPLVGLIKSVEAGPVRAQDPGFHSLGVSLPDLFRVSDVLNTNKAGGGGEEIEVALAATVGETVERYCMLFYDKEQMTYAPYREVAEHAVEPDLIRLHSRAQSENGSSHIIRGFFDDDTPIYWQWGHSLTSGRPRLVPASQVYLNYRMHKEEGSAGHNASTGLAAGATLEEAILTGLLECIERDAFTLAWQHRNFGRRVRVDDERLAEKLSRHFRTDHPDVELEIYDITTDLPIPSLFAMCRRPSEFGPALLISTVARLDARAALAKCLREMGQCLPYLRYLSDQLADWTPADDHSDITSFDHHFTLYLKRPELVDEAIGFRHAVDQEIALSQLPNHATGRPLGDIERAVELLDSLGLEVIVVDLTTPDIRDVGLHVVRVMVPGLVPLHGNHATQYLGVQRLYDVPAKLGWYPPGTDIAAQLNPYPHPFP